MREKVGIFYKIFLIYFNVLLLMGSIYKPASK